MKYKVFYEGYEIIEAETITEATLEFCKHKKKNENVICTRGFYGEETSKTMGGEVNA